MAACPARRCEPTGDPMRDGVGPASYAQRADMPDLTFEGLPKIVPLRVAAEASRSRRGIPIRAACR